MTGIDEPFTDRIIWQERHAVRRYTRQRWAEIMPPKFRGATLEELNQPDEVITPGLEWLNAAADETGANLVALGPTGTGKTYYVAALAEARWVDMQWCSECIQSSRPWPRTHWCVRCGAEELIFENARGRMICPGCNKPTWATQAGECDEPNHLHRVRYQVKFAPAVEMFSALQPNGGATIADFTEPALLVLDDIGVTKPSEWEQKILYEIVNARWLAERSTLVTANCTITQLRKVLGERVWDRLRDNSEAVHISGPSRRRSYERSGAA